jgi:hypothetical protein
MAKRFSSTQSPAAPGRKSVVSPGQTQQQQDDEARADRNELRAGAKMSGRATRLFMDTLRKKKSV